MRFVWANDSHFPAVLSLWQQGFPEDSEEEIRAFWKAMCGEMRCLICEEKGQALSMACLIPASLRINKKGLPLWYVYAAVTHPARRGQGLFAALLDEAGARAAQNGVSGLFLRPAEPSLFHYYARCGFASSFSVVRKEWQVSELYNSNETVSWKSIKRGYASVRNTWLEKLGAPFVEWTDAVADLAAQSDCALVCKHGAVLCSTEEDTLFVQELLCAPHDRERLLSSLTRLIPCRKIVAQWPVLQEENAVLFGMLRLFDGAQRQTDDLYMGLTLE